MSNQILNDDRITILTGFPLFLSTVAIPERYQIVNGTSALSAGIRLMPMLCASAIGSTASTVFNSKRNSSFYTLCGANCLLLLGSGLMSKVPIESAIPKSLYGYQIIFGFGEFEKTFTVSTMVYILMENRHRCYFVKHYHRSCHQFELHRLL